MYRHETGRCGCGASGLATIRTGSNKARRYGRIDSDGQCVCDECEPCGVLDCQCRPRFFDGQLITAADFRRLDQYIVAKSRLHNRYLHGVGVVCGLEAVCNPCDDTITVRAGYALGPCGEDIVVCHDARVDVAALIKEQRAAMTRTDCAPYSEPTKDSEAARQKWVLGICYEERAAKPVTSLKSAGCGCGCGGSGGGCGGSGDSNGGSCGCGGHSASGTAGVPSCEPTQICEGYRFTLTKLRPEARPPQDGVVGAAASAELPRLVAECLRRLRIGLTHIPRFTSTDALVSYAHELKEDLRQVIEAGNVHDCTLGQRLFAITIPEPADEHVGALTQAAVQAMLQIAVDLYRDCVCSALLPHCDEGCADDCLPLAVLTVRSSDLHVLDICNWSARRFAITMPTLQYWLGWTPIFGALHDAIARLCCGQIRQPRFRLTEHLRVLAEEVRGPGDRARAGGPTEGGAEHPGAGRAGEPSGGERSYFAALAAQYRRGRSPLSGLEATVFGALGAQTSDGTPVASELELTHPLAALTLGQLGPAAVAELLPPELADRLARQVEPPVVDEARIAGLEETVTKLQRTVESQARTIRTLKRKGPTP